MHDHKSLIFYLAAALFLSLAYFALPISGGDGWHLFPGLKAMAQAIRSSHRADVFDHIHRSFVSGLSRHAGDLHGGGFLLGEFGGGACGAARQRLWRVGRVFILSEAHSTTSQCSIKSTVRHENWLTLLGLRLSPLVPAPMVNFLAVVLHVSPLQCLTAGLLGGAPLVVFYAQIGQQGHQFLSGETLHWWQFSGYLVILTFGALLSAMGPWRSVLNELKRLKGSYGSETLPLQPDLGRNP